MDFIDEVKVYVKAGDGGSGICSFRREKFIEFGGPNGGDGGRGGDIRFVASNNVNTLLKLKYYPHIKAKNGQKGGKKNRYGASGEDAIIMVPLGTQIFDEYDNMLHDLSLIGQEALVANGGKGGVGNYRFKSSTNRSPRRFTEGDEGEECTLIMQLKLIADVGIVGFPNIGKSTFLAMCSAATPKIANYPFTTLEPNVGVVSVNHRDFVVADIPGIIEGAHMGIGLGYLFLKHIERCRVILHMIDATVEDLKLAYFTTRNELEQYSKENIEKKEIIALSKCDLLDEEEVLLKKIELENFTGKEVYTVSYEQKPESLLNYLAEIFCSKSEAEESVYDPLDYCK